MESVLIAGWGIPWRWKRVRYKLGESEKEARSSLACVFEELKPQKVIIIALDSAIKDLDKGLNNYRDLVGKIEREYRSFVEEEGLNLKKEVEIIVSPGIGLVSGKDFSMRFEGSLEDFFYSTLFQLSKKLIELEENSRVYLDLTHGVNFMPTLVYRAVKEILCMMAFGKHSINLAVYNSEPYVEGVSKLEIHPVEEKVIQPELYAYRLGEKGEKKLLTIRRRMKKNEEVFREGVVKVSQRQREELNAFLSAIHNGFPLALLRFYPNKEELFKKLEEVYQQWFDLIEVSANDSEIKIVRRASFTEDFAKCVKIWVAAESFGLERKSEVEIGELESISKKLFWHSGTHRGLISRTFHDLKNVLKREMEWTRLSEIIKGGKFSILNFLAHAGLEYNVTEACVKNGAIWLRYSEDEIENIIKGCEYGLSRGR